MRSLNHLNRIAELLAIFSAEVSVRSKASFTDINRLSQDVVCRLFQIIYDLQDLRNLDLVGGANHPAVDLGDDVRRVAVQVSSDGSGDKIKKTFEAFSRNGLHARFDFVKFFILTGKQDRYGPGVIATVPRGMVFDPKKDILDSNSLLPLIQAMEPNDQIRILDVLEGEFGESGLHWSVVRPDMLRHHQETFVPPKEFAEALRSLGEGKLLILTGAPHVGKSSTALGLLSCLREKEGGRRVLRLSVTQALIHTAYLRHELILIDDAFGEVELRNTEGANAIGDLERLAQVNRVVITSRKAVLEEARKRTKFGESLSPRRLIVELTPDESYDDDDLAKVLDRHLIFQSSEYMTSGTRIPIGRAEEIRKFTSYIVYKLRFPHNIERLVSAWDTIPFEGRYIDTLISLSKDIEQAARRWYEGLADEQRLSVCVCALFPKPSVRERSSIATDLGIRSINERTLARDSGGYLAYGYTLTLTHPSYREGVLRSLRNDYIEDAAKVLCAAARNLEHFDFHSICRIKLAYGLVENACQRHELFLRQENIPSLEYYRRYIRAYNVLIEQDFPNLRRMFSPHCEGEARMHLYRNSDSDFGSWTMVARRPGGPEITESEETPDFHGERLTSVELEQLEFDPWVSLSTHFDGEFRTPIPEIAAFNYILKQLEGQLSSRAGIHIGKTLRLADLMQDLESAAFPIEQIGPMRPLTSQWISDWASTFFDLSRTGVWPTDSDGRKLRFTLREAPCQINDLDVEWAMGFVDSLIAEGVFIEGPLLVRRDLPLDRPLRIYPFATHSDWYSDAALVKAVETGLRTHHQAVRETIAEAFPTISRRMSNRWTRPGFVVCIVDRTIDEWRRRPSVVIGYRLKDDDQTDELRVQVHLISLETSPEEAQRLWALRDGFWKNRDEYFASESHGLSSLIELKEWRKSVQEDVQDALESYLDAEEHRLFRAYK